MTADKQSCDLSVIIPFRNTEGFESLFSATIDQWLSEDLLSIELILIGDDPPESSLWVEEKVAQLELTHQVRLLTLGERVGIGAARNAGLSLATGTAVYFMDADDAVDTEVVCRSTHQALTSKSDLSTFAFAIRSHESAGVQQKVYRPGTKTISQLIARHAAVWRFVFVRDYLLREDLMFPNTSYGEDLMFLVDVAQSDPVIEHSDEVGYWHHMRPDSSSATSISTVSQHTELAKNVSLALREESLAPSLAAGLSLWHFRVARRRRRLIRQSVPSSPLAVVRQAGLFKVAVGAFRVFKP